MHWWCCLLNKHSSFWPQPFQDAGVQMNLETGHWTDAAGVQNLKDEFTQLNISFNPGCHCVSVELVKWIWSGLCWASRLEFCTLKYSLTTSQLLLADVKCIVGYLQAQVQTSDARLIKWAEQTHAIFQKYAIAHVRTSVLRPVIWFQIKSDANLVKDRTPDWIVRLLPVPEPDMTAEVKGDAPPGTNYKYTRRPHSWSCGVLTHQPAFRWQKVTGAVTPLDKRRY